MILINSIRHYLKGLVLCYEVFSFTLEFYNFLYFNNYLNVKMDKIINILVTFKS